MRLGVCQMNVLQGEVQRNRETAERMIREAADEGARVVVLPELWTCGYDFDRLDHHTEDMEGASVRMLADLAKNLHVLIVGGSLPVRYKHGVANTAVVFDEKGKLVNVYRKIHLIGLMEEDRYLLPGEDLGCFELPGGAAGSTLVCYDLRFPELARAAILMGAQVLFFPAQWPVQRQSHWDALLVARAIENQAFVVGANMSGRNRADRFEGGSAVIDPWGNIAARAESNPEILYADIDLSLVKQVRQRVPSLRDRRPFVYRKFNRDQPTFLDS